VTVQMGYLQREEQSVTATATIKNQKTSHWFLCYKFVKGIIVAHPSEKSNKTKCQTSIHELLSRCLANKYYCIESEVLTAVVVMSSVFWYAKRETSVKQILVPASNWFLAWRILSP
jgi:hypothetical protein